jgi:hypothetical protein
VIVVAGLSLACSVWLWLAPTRLAAGTSLALLLCSLARIGGPSEWNGYGLYVFAGTLLVAIPVIAAVATTIRST